jgi:NCS2 family nucleobase:cation symporter-2
MIKEQSDIIYGLDDVPPAGALLMLSFQQMMLLFTAATFPALLVREVGGSVELASSMVAMTMVAAGLGSILQALRLPGIGSGYLCPNLCGPSYLGVSLQAAWLGGFPVMHGMIVFAGVLEMLLANVIRHIRFLFPTVVVGLVVMMVGVNVIAVSVTNFFGVAYAYDSVRGADLLVGCLALLTMVGCNLWGRGALRMYCLLIGIVVGWAAALVLTPEIWGDYQVLHSQSLFALPVYDWREQFRLSFSAELALPFILIAVCGSLKSFGNLLAAQKISEPELKGVNMKPVANGLVADGFTTAMAGFMGALAVDTSSSNIGLAAATRAVSRWIAVVTGAVFAFLGFFPKLSMLIALVPRPVVGASLIFAVSIMICTGLKEMLEEPLDQRKIYTIGIAMIFGLSTQFVPALYAALPAAYQPLFQSPLATSTLFAIVTYQVFHFDELKAALRRKKA